MKHLPICLLVMLGAIVPLSAIAQESPTAVPVSTQGAVFLQVQPISRDRAIRSSNQPSPFTAADLNNAAAGLQIKPQKPTNSILPASVMQPRTPTAINPLEFFQVPGLDGSVKVRLSQD